MDETCKRYIISYYGNLFRSYRNTMNAKYYDPYNTDEEGCATNLHTYQMMNGGGSLTFRATLRQR